MAEKHTEKGDQPFDFENALRELENLVERIERGDLTLEQSLKDFERGVELTRSCQGALQEAEQRVRVLLDKSEKADLSDFKPNKD